MSQIGFLHPLLPSISLTDISNLKLDPYKKDSTMVRAIMSELVSVFKDIAQLQPIFREQSKCLDVYLTFAFLTSSHLIHHVQLHFQRL
jgi:hypothetical protein